MKKQIRRFFMILMIGLFIFYVGYSIYNFNLEKFTKIEKGYRILLTTDKLIYQPGQTIHMRTLVFQNSRPSNKKKTRLEVYEPKGYKVFQKEVVTCDYGIGNAEFTLAKEINEGTYTIKAKAGKYVKEKRVQVKRYVLPKFKVECITDKPWYSPGEVVKGTVKAVYFFGKPVNHGQVKIIIGKGEEAEPIADIQGITNSRGIFTFEYKAKSSGSIILTISVRDKAQHMEQTSRAVPISRDGIRIELIPEGKRPKYGLENIIYVVTSYPDGNPAACNVIINKNMQIQTNRWGIGRFKMFIEHNKKNTIDVKAEDSRGNNGKVFKDFYNYNCSNDTVILRTDKAIYRTGESARLRILSTRNKGRVYVDFLKDGQAVLTKEVELKGGEALLELPIGEHMKGNFICCACLMVRDSYYYQGLRTLWDMKQVIVEPSRESEVEVVIQPGKKQYSPGEQAVIHFFTRQRGKGYPVALGVHMVDESVAAISPADNDIEEFYFNLHQNLLKPDVRPAGFTFPYLLWKKRENITPTYEEKQQIGKVLLASQRVDDYDSIMYQTISQFSQKLEEIKVKKIKFQVVQMYFLIFLAIALIVILISFTRKEKRKKWLGKLVADISFSLLILYVQYLIFILLLVWLMDNVSPGDSREMMITGFLFLLLLIISIVMTVYYYKRDGFKLYYGWYYAANFLFVTAVLFFSYEYGAGMLFSFITILVAAVTAIFSFKILRYAVKNRQMHIFWSLLIFILYLVTFYGYLEAVSRYYWDAAVLPTLALIIIPVVFIVYVIRLVRSGNKIAVPLTSIILISWLIPVLLVKYTNVRQHYPYLFTNNETSPRIYGMDLGTMWCSRSSSLLPVFPREEPPLYKKENIPEATQRPLKLKLRQFFPETLYVNPRVITDENGQASLHVKLADNITQWRLSALAHTLDGAMGTGYYQLPVFQDFFVDMDLPLYLTQGDELSISVAVFNYSPNPQEVTLKLQPDHADNWFELQGNGVRTLSIKPNDITVEYFKINAREAGNHQLTVQALGKSMSDEVKKDVTVIFGGKELCHSFSDRLTGEIRQKISIPPYAVKNSEKLIIKFYPGLSAQLVEGLDSLLQMPSGCFEQTASVTYPNILVLNYMTGTGQLTPGIEKRALKYISSGYQRLLTFETKTGGFSLYGKGNGKSLLTAYGLQLFTDMSKVYSIDRTLIPRIRQWLFSQMKGDHWAPDSNYGSPIFFSNNKFTATAYVTWSLLYSGVEESDPRLKKALVYLGKNYKNNLNDPIALSLYVLSRLKAKKNAGSALQRLEELAVKDTHGTYWSYGIRSKKERPFPLKIIESTALTVLACIEAKHSPAETSRAMRFLIKSKSPYGNWGTTQATVLTLKVLGNALSGITEPAYGTINVWIEGKPVRKIQITKENNDMLHILGFKDFARSGDWETRITFEGKGELFCQVVSSYYVKWEQFGQLLKSVDHDDLLSPRDNKNAQKLLRGGPDASRGGFLEKSPPGRRRQKTKPLIYLNLVCDRVHLQRGEMLSVEVISRYTGQGMVNNAIMSLGLPPGFKVMRSDFERIKNQCIIERFELSSGRVVLYISNLDKKGISFQYRLKALTAARVQMPFSMVYDYYHPQIKAEVKPMQLNVVL